MRAPSSGYLAQGRDAADELLVDGVLILCDDELESAARYRNAECTTLL